MRGEQAIFNLEIKKKSGLSINPDIHHSKVFSSGFSKFSIASYKKEMRRSFSEIIRNLKQTIQRNKNLKLRLQSLKVQTHWIKIANLRFRGFRFILSSISSPTTKQTVLTPLFPAILGDREQKDSRKTWNSCKI